MSRCSWRCLTPSTHASCRSPAVSLPSHPTSFLKTSRRSVRSPLTATCTFPFASTLAHEADSLVKLLWRRGGEGGHAFGGAVAHTPRRVKPEWRSAGPGKRAGGVARRTPIATALEGSAEKPLDALRRPLAPSKLGRVRDKRKSGHQILRRETSTRRGGTGEATHSTSVKVWQGRRTWKVFLSRTGSPAARACVSSLDAFSRLSRNGADAFFGFLALAGVCCAAALGVEKVSPNTSKGRLPPTGKRGRRGSERCKPSAAPPAPGAWRSHGETLPSRLGG